MADNKRTAATKQDSSRGAMPSGKGADESIIPEEISEFLQDVAPEKRKELEQIMISQFSMISRVSPEAEITRKVTSEHISKMLDTQDKAMERSFKDLNHKRFFILGSSALGLIALVVVIVLLRDQPEFMEKVLTVIFSGGLGVAGGFGAGYVKGKKDD